MQPIDFQIVNRLINEMDGFYGRFPAVAHITQAIRAELQATYNEEFPGTDAAAQFLTEGWRVRRELIGGHIPCVVVTWASTTHNFEAIEPLIRSAIIKGVVLSHPHDQPINLLIFPLV